MGDDDLKSNLQHMIRVQERQQDLDRMIGDRLIAVASALEHNTAAQLVLRKDVYDMRQQLELREASAALEKQAVAERLAKIEAVVGIVQRDMGEVRENTGAHPLQKLDVDDSGKGAPGAARRAWRDFLRAPTRSQVAALALVAIIGLGILGYFAIKNGYRAQQLEHEGAPIHSKEK